MKDKRTFQKDLLFLSISSFVVVAAWIGFNIFHSSVTTTISPELQKTIVPISADFDMATIEALRSRKKVAPVTTLTNQGVPTPSPTTIEIGPTNERTPAAELPGELLPTTEPQPRTPPEEDIPVTLDGQ